MPDRVGSAERPPEAPGAETFSLVEADPAQTPGSTLSPLQDRVQRELEALRAAGGGAGAGTSDVTAAAVRSGAIEALPLLRLGDDDADLVLLEPIGEGGMGRVHLARQRALEREVAVKQVRPDRATPAAFRGLLAEARLTGALEHPNIVPVHALGLDQAGRPLLVMKRVEGVGWRDLIRDPDHPAWGDHAADPLGRHLEILVQVCNAVHFAHSRGVIHCDLKTENVMLGAFGEIYVLDWGIAVRADRPREPVVAGTPAFMAPEMVREDGIITERTDVYLLGGMLHEALTGRHRHLGVRTRDVLEAARVSAPPEYGPEVPAELAALCVRATARDPADRPASALAFRQALVDFQRHRGSLVLAEQAGRVAEELERALAALPDAGGGAATAGLDPRRVAIRRLAAEAAFGYRQALAQWPENAVAAEGLRGCLERTARFELDERNPHSAATALEELDPAPPELRRRLEALRREVEEESRATAELSQLRHESSAEVALATRTWLMTGVHGVLGLFWLWMAHLGLGITHLGIMAFAGSLLVALAAGFYLLRDSLLANQLNRRVLYSLVAFCLFTFAHASLGAIRHVPVDHLAWGGYLGISLMFAVLALTLTPTVGLLVPPTLVSAVYCAFLPERINESLALFNFGCAVAWLVPLVWARLRGTPPPPGPGGPRHPSAG